ncbi:MAG TPA: lipocalin family protein [Candidatus Acidoferrales bacterium]|nr:lipocalin family protein [Candidatus Acidoferrales bacterium]
MHFSKRALAAAAIGGSVAAASVAVQAMRARGGDAPLETVPYVDLDRYQGRWFEIARYPARFERDCAKNTTAEYAAGTRGRIRVVNRCSTKDGRPLTACGWATVADPETNAKLRVRFSPFMPSAPYWIFGLAEDYRYALVGEPKRRFVWMLSRTPKVEEELYRQLCAEIDSAGYDSTLLLRTIQD